MELNGAKASQESRTMHVVEDHRRYDTPNAACRHHVPRYVNFAPVYTVLPSVHFTWRNTVYTLTIHLLYIIILFMFMNL